ncbi:MAG: V-type ATPase 116kDa subunit family protein [Bacteroidales bacterium]|nr:V-type ATPase 116kDa subunit family protein [Bacteroidales bacterium]
MIKYSFLIYHKEYLQFLEELQKLGMLHIIQKTKEVNEQIKESLNEIGELNKTIKLLEKRNVIEKPVDYSVDGFAILEKIKRHLEEIALIDLEQEELGRDIQKATPFGDFSNDIKEKFEKVNIQFKFYSCSEKKFKEEWKTNYYLEIINQIKGSLYFVVLQQDNEQINIDAEEIKLPKETLSILKNKYAANSQRIEEINKALDEISINYKQVLLSTRKEIQVKTDYNLAINQTEKQAEEKVLLIEGWIPEEKKEELELFLQNQTVVYVSTKPASDDKVPILLKNGKFAKLFEPIGKLFSLPNYVELDLTVFFAPFFMLFFGLCVGDSGYGLVLLLGTLLYRRKAKPDLKPILTLAAWLGGATVILGMLTGTVFGFSLGELNLFSSYKKYFLQPIVMFYLAIAVGMVQIIFGMGLKAANQIKQRGYKYGLSTIGWILLILTLGLFVGGEKAGLNLESLSIVKIVLFAISFGLIFLFNNPDKNIFANLGLGIYESYNMVTGIFGDMLSYIRLFALGISSSILGLVFNQISIPFLSIDYWGWIPFILLLLIGHGLNIFLSCLSGIVHPMRLTFVEFYKNAGFNGGGKEYKPFSK